MGEQSGPLKDILQTWGFDPKEAMMSVKAICLAAGIRERIFSMSTPWIVCLARWHRRPLLPGSPGYPPLPWLQEKAQQHLRQPSLSEGLLSAELLLNHMSDWRLSIPHGVGDDADSLAADLEGGLALGWMRRLYSSLTTASSGRRSLGTPMLVAAHLASTRISRSSMKEAGFAFMQMV